MVEVAPVHVAVPSAGQDWRFRLKQSVPWIMHGIRAVRWMKSQATFPIVGALLEWRARGRVLGGPFKGMRFPGSGIGGAYYQNLLGSYEWSLIPAVEAAIARKPATIVDAGAAYGYYAIGLAMRCPQARVVAYEMDQTRRDLLRKYAGLNGVGLRVELRGLCTAEDLVRDVTAAPGVLVVMDVEGAEDILLTEDAVEQFRHVELLIETHDHFVPGVTRRLQQRFAHTHAQTVIGYEEAKPAVPLYEAMTRLPFLRPMLARMINEYRDADMVWLHLRPL